jgi:hypothetical protein
MDTLVVSTLLIQSFGIIATVIALALGSCLPRRRQLRNWVAIESAPALNTVPGVDYASEAVEEAALPRAA